MEAIGRATAEAIAVTAAWPSSQPERENKYLNMPLMRFGDAGSAWTVRNAVEGVQIFGGIGSGKTSGSGRTLALNYLASGFGGLVLTVKPDEKSTWEEQYCPLAGRDPETDLLVIEPGGKYHFNFLEYVSRGGLTDNIVQVLKTVMRASDEKEQGKSHDPFWETALDMLIFYVVDFCRIAYGSVTVKHMYDIVQSLPRPEGNEGKAGKKNAFREAGAAATARVNAMIDDEFKDVSAEDLKRMREDGTYERAVYQRVPDARLLRMAEHYFMETYQNLSEKTRSIIDFSFSGFLFRFFSEPFYSLFCEPTERSQAVEPEDCLDGKIILLDLPVKKYHKVGRDCQIMFKYIWQRSMEQREIGQDSPPVFLWADEAQNFLHEHDAEYQATARSSMIATVYLSQNLPNYYASMGGAKPEYRVKSFLGTLSTKVFHANADTETNNYASEMVGDHEVKELSATYGQSGNDWSRSQSITRKVERVLRPEHFQGFATGGRDNNYLVSAVVHTQGKRYGNGVSFAYHVFDQKYRPIATPRPLPPQAAPSPSRKHTKSLLEQLALWIGRFLLKMALQFAAWFKAEVWPGLAAFVSRSGKRIQEGYRNWRNRRMGNDS